jgi:hypothetical protein
VTSPQKGHIRWDVKSPAWASIFRNFLSEAPSKARRLRRLARSGCGEKDMFAIPRFYSNQTTMTHRGPAFCARLLSFATEVTDAGMKTAQVRARLQVSNSDQLFPQG